MELEPKIVENLLALRALRPSEGEKEMIGTRTTTPAPKRPNRVKQALNLFGIDTDKVSRTLLGLPRYMAAMRTYRTASRGQTKFPLRFGLHYPMVEDADESAGSAQGDYFHQDLWAAKRIFERKPSRHVDVGSRIDGFIAHLLIFMPVEVIDIRPLVSKVPGLSFTQEDATTLARFEDNSLDSLSSLHAVEHFGLGRYGDPIDPNGWLSAMSSLARVLSPGGRLYFSVPVGKERVVFNAHRVFSPQTVLDAFSALTLVSFSAVNSLGDLDVDISLDSVASSRHSCGLFEFTK